MTLIIAESDPKAPGAVALLEASHALMHELFPPETNHAFSVDRLCAPNVRFYTARKSGQTVGTGALVIYEGYGEVKAMFTAPDARGLGAGAAILRAIEDHARSEGLPCLRLETGNTLHAAHRLYERQGFGFCGPFGSYREDPASLFMEKPLMALEPE